MNINNISPQVGFEINITGAPVEQRTDGIIHVVALTESGDINSPKTVITSVSQFQNLFGSEIVPDGSLSNIEVMLGMGAAVRVSRVASNTLANWTIALQALADYDDAYSLISSHIHQNLALADLYTYYKYMADNIVPLNNVISFIEIPSKEGDTIYTDTDIITYKQGIEAYIGSTPFVAYFTGGIKYFDEVGDQTSCDSLGTVAGLSALSEMEYGPWYHFSGMNRGIVTSAIGIVTANYGSNVNLDKINALAQESINLFVVKSTRTQGRVPMLWHNFTAYDEKSSFRFLGIARLYLYIKKNLVNILESYLEEPLPV